MSLHVVFWSLLAVGFVIALPLILTGSMLNYLRGRGSARCGGGGMSAGVGAALQELDRLAARPSIEHQIEVERHTTKRVDDVGGE
jgi:hypothetical protein